LAAQIEDSRGCRVGLAWSADRRFGAVALRLAPEPGKTWTRNREFSVKIAGRLSGIALSDSAGGTRRLADYWRDQPIVLVFIRHFG